MIHAAPGDPLSAYVRRARLSPEQLERLSEEYGLNDPIPVGYLKWLTHVVQGDLGHSLTTKRPVMVEILERLPNTFYLMSIAFTLVVVFAVPIGIHSAARQYSAFDIVVTTVAFIGQALPEFWFGVILLIVFYGMLTNPLTGGPFLPPGGMYTLGEDFSLSDRIMHLILPVTTLAFGWVSWYSRFVRSSMLEVIHQDYITTARAKGLIERIVVYRHALKNAMLPFITLVALDLPYLFAGALYTEIIFSWPGMGRLFYNAARRRDYPLLMAIIMIVALLVILFNLLADIAYAYLDPRVRFETKEEI
jgi:peptide/nickel transport system permease protein